LSEGSGRERDAKLTALFRFAHYFGWREFVRTEVQLLRFENEEDTRSAAGFLNDVAEVLASDLLDGKWAMLWNDEQRGIGELMTERPSRTAPIVRGHAAFYRDYDKTFAPWMERFAGDLLSPAALNSDRLRLLQWTLYGLVRQLDEEGTYGGVWIDRSASEIRRPAQHGVSPSTRNDWEGISLRSNHRPPLYHGVPIDFPARDYRERPDQRLCFSSVGTGSGRFAPDATSQIPPTLLWRRSPCPTPVPPGPISVRYVPPTSRMSLPKQSAAGSAPPATHRAMTTRPYP